MDLLMGMQVRAVEGFGEIASGDDLSELLAQALEDGQQHGLQDGDIVVVTSKIVSKSEGQLRTGSRDDFLASETVRVVARRGPTTIVENHLGLVMAAAGIDASNTAAGTIVLLPRDPDASARTLRESLARRCGANVAVIVTDTAGRAWRQGQTDIAIGAAGIHVLESFAGSHDAHGNELAVTEPAIADEIASAAELVTGKLGGRPVSIVRGLGDRVLEPGVHGPGARVAVRPKDQDLFALGAREAVIAAVAGEQADGFGATAERPELRQALVRAGIEASDLEGGIAVGEHDLARAQVLAFAHGWRSDGTQPTLLLPTT